MASGVSGYFDLQDNSYGATLRVHYSETYDIASNTSTVSISKLEVKQTAYYGFTHYLDGSITINGAIAVSMSSYNGTHGVYTGALNTFYQVGGTLGSVDVTHNADGSKSIAISVSVKAYKAGTSGAKWSVSGSTTVALTTIPRASTLSVANGTLGTEQTIKVTRQSTAFSHTITYTCGTASGTVCDKSTSESISFTPPIDLASQNTTGVSVTMKLTLQTYSGSTAIGSTVSVTVAMAIPASVKPECSLNFMDVTGYATSFGGYVQGQSKLQVDLVGKPAYGSPIASYRATVDGITYTQESFTTEVLKTSGEQNISATVTDRRGRTSDTATASITVLAYSVPQITALSVHRCNADGAENNTGSYAKVTYSFSITSLSSKNDKTITLKYKKSSASAYTSVTLTSAYSATNASYVFAADDGSSYDIVLVVADTFTSSQRGTSVSTADVIMHFRADGKGMGVGKVSEKANTLDMGWDIELNGHNLLKNGTVPFAPAGFGLGEYVATKTALADADSATLSGRYKMDGNTANGVGVSATLIVDGYANTYVTQTAIRVSTGYIQKRHCMNDVWSEWEWENPPMVTGVEYRTTERYGGKPVYRKLINVGTSPSVAVTEIALPDTTMRIFEVTGKTSAEHTIPNTYSTDHHFSIGGSYNVVRLRNSHGYYGGQTVYAYLKYTKSTD